MSSSVMFVVHFHRLQRITPSIPPPPLKGTAFSFCCTLSTLVYLCMLQVKKGPSLSKVWKFARLFPLENPPQIIPVVLLCKDVHFNEFKQRAWVGMCISETNAKTCLVATSYIASLLGPKDVVAAFADRVFHFWSSTSVLTKDLTGCNVSITV